MNSVRTGEYAHSLATATPAAGGGGGGASARALHAQPTAPRRERSAADAVGSSAGQKMACTAVNVSTAHIGQQGQQGTVPRADT